MNNNAPQLLKKYFGFDSFVGLQEEIITHVVANNDCLVLMPTGGGKSICFQIPALLREGITLVISPLISLMKDQVDALKANGINAEFLNSSLSYDEEREIAEQCVNGEIKLLYLSPEKALSLLDNFLIKLPVSLIAIDEAHCVSQWGHDFRPEYKQIFKLREKFSDVPMMALTATADKITRSDILQLLGLKNPRQFVASFDRPNISLNVKPGLIKREKIKEIHQFINAHKNQCGIIYCTSRDSTETLANELSKLGINAKSYHAGMNSADRIKVQDAFVNDNVQVVCATIAFGMGIDKSNVRFVIHYNLPRSVEGYYQEIGRGGRDGLPCDALLFYSIGDLILLRKFAEDSGQPEISLEKLKRMQEFVEAKHCRRKILLNYFGQQFTENCNNCDVCLHPPKTFDGTIAAQKVLSALTRLENINEKVGTHLLVDVLRGLKHKEIVERKLDQIKTYGAGSDLSTTEWNQYLLQMIQLGVIEIAYDDQKNLRITSFGDLILKGKSKLFLTNAVNEIVVKKKKSFSFNDVDISTTLFEQLRVLRKQIADRMQLPPYIIFHDSTLKQMVELMPKDINSMLEITGMSMVKMENYGHEFLEIIKQYKENENTPAIDPRDYLSNQKLQSYMDELLDKKLRFSAVIIGKVLTGSTLVTYHQIGAKVSFYGLLEGIISYEAIIKTLKKYYTPFEKSIKEKKATQQNYKNEVTTKFFEANIFNRFTDEQHQIFVKTIAAIPIQKPTETITSEHIIEMRKTFPRSHEPWSIEEEKLLEKAITLTNDKNVLCSIFLRSGNSLMAMSSKFLENSN